MTLVTNVDGDYIAYDPYDHCRHGVYVGGCGIDFMCHACEMGDPDPTPRDLITQVDRLARELWTWWDTMIDNLRRHASVANDAQVEFDRVLPDLADSVEQSRLAGDLRRAISHRDAVLAMANGLDDDAYLARQLWALRRQWDDQVHRWARENGYVLVEAGTWLHHDREVSVSDVYRAYERER